MTRFLGLTAIAASALLAQTPQPTTLTDMLNQRYSQVKTSITNAAAQMPEQNYGFKPVPEEFSFAEWVAHVADVEVRQCSTVNGAAKSVDAASKKTKAEMVAALKAAFDECDAAFAKLTDQNAMDMVGLPGRPAANRAAQLAYVTAHDNEAYGAMAVYMRLKGIVPPSTQLAQATAQAAAAGRGASGGQGRGR